MAMIDIKVKVKVNTYFKLLGLFGRKFRLFAIMHLLPDSLVVHRVYHDDNLIDIQRIGDLKKRIKAAKAGND